MKIYKFKNSKRIIFLVVRNNRIVFKSLNEDECLNYMYNKI